MPVAGPAAMNPPCAAKPAPPRSPRTARVSGDATRSPRRSPIPDREIVRIWATREAAAEVDLPKSVPFTFADAADLGRLVPHDAPHQGLVVEVERLDDLLLADMLQDAPERRPLAGPRPGHRSAQCRRHPALGGGVRRSRAGHPGPARAARIGGPRQGGERGSRDGALGAGGQPRPSARRDGRGGLLADRTDRRRRA